MASPTPFDLGPAHIVGIGGIGMSGIADVMITMGYDVQGSDIKDSDNIERLRQRGAKVFIGHKAENVKGAGTVIISSAIKGDNPEVAMARAGGNLASDLGRKGAHTRAGDTKLPKPSGSTSRAEI